MAKVTNTFIKNKLNQDLDARLLPNGEYRNALNIQVSKSEGANVGSLENVLGNVIVKDFEALTGVDDLICIGFLTDEFNSTIYLFLTDNPKSTDLNPEAYKPTANNFIFSYNTLLDDSDNTTLLVEGAWLNFSKNFPITGINILEGLLFWTDNRNQPRKIDTIKANPSRLANPIHYVSEDQISVAKYNPYDPIQTWKKSTEAGSETWAVPYESTMKDVSSKFMPNGGSADVIGAYPGGTANIPISTVKGDIQFTGSNAYDSNSTISYINSNSGEMFSTGLSVVNYNTSVDPHEISTSGSMPSLPSGTEIVFNANPYYKYLFAGDPDYLEDRFIRFSYRYQFEDGEYSIFAPFTQIAFIPKQDGYFLFVNKEGIPEKDDQSNTYRSTIVSFMENKVDDIELRIPLPTGYTGADISEGLKITKIDILYKESDALAVKVVDTIDVENIEFVDDYFSYQYESKKPFKTLPSKDLIRVFDVIPVKALSQEIISNRLVYGNFQDKHTPPDTINYSVNVGAKKPFNLQNGTAIADSQTDSTTILISSKTGTILVGSIITNLLSGGNPVVVTALDDLLTEITVSGPVTITASQELIFEAAADDTQYTSTVENPNHSIKQNRNYQVGIVLSDRFGRQSSVIISNDSVVAREGGDEFVGSTIYSPYQTTAVEQNEWPGDSLKVLFNDPIGPANPNTTTGWPGLYNGDITSLSYNPLGWYSYKIVVKQTEQEYYNVYLPGIMAAYPESTTLEIGNTSHAILINDNINKVPRDLNEVGPDQKQFRSSVRLFGRVENTATEISFNGIIPQNIGLSNDQYFPGRESDTVSTISTLNDLFNYDPNTPPRPDYFPQFYSFLSNPLVARISTDDKIGQIATTNYNTASALVDSNGTAADIVILKNVVGIPAPSMVVFGGGLPVGTTVQLWTPDPTDSSKGELNFSADVTLSENAVLTFAQGFGGVNVGTIIKPGIQYLAVYETEPVESELDIFWESSTAGLVSDLNYLILNTTGGGATFSSFNTNDWDETINWQPELSANILTDDFTLLDTFGQPIDDFTLFMPIVRNGSNVDVKNYFELFPSTTPNYYNVRVTEDYWDNIYFGSNANLRNFTFNFIGVVDTVSTPFLEIGNPNNIGPTISDPMDEGCGQVIYTNRTVENLATKWAVNGASNEELRNADLSWEIVSQYNTDTLAPTTGFVLDLDDAQGGFGYLIGSPDYVSETIVQNSNPNRLPASYTVNLQVTDPGQQIAECSLIFEMRGTATSWKPIVVYSIANVTQFGQDVFNIECVYFYVEANPYGATPGWYFYIYNIPNVDPFISGTNAFKQAAFDATVSNGAVGILRTASTSTTSGSLGEGDWFFSAGFVDPNKSLEQTAWESFELACSNRAIPSPPFGPADSDRGSVQTDFQGNVVEFI